jgi:hypothetical protein
MTSRGPVLVRYENARRGGRALTKNYTACFGSANYFF